MKHLQNCCVLPDRRELLRRLPAGGTVAEIGVASGDFSNEILRINQPAMLHLVDMWASGRFAPGYAQVTSRFADEIAAGRVSIHRGKSVDVLEGFPDESLDWVYIDTDHGYETTLAELGISATKVKPTGYIAGHDFSRGSPISGASYGVIAACHQFCVEQGWQFAYLTVEHEIMFSYCLARLPSQ